MNVNPRLVSMDTRGVCRTEIGVPGTDNVCGESTSKIY